MAAKSSDKCPRCTGVVLTTLSQPNCMKCGTRWLSNVDFRAEVNAAKKGKASYLQGELQEDLRDLVLLIEYKTLCDIVKAFENSEKTAMNRREMLAEGTVGWERADEQLNTTRQFLKWARAQATMREGVVSGNASS